MTRGADRAGCKCTLTSLLLSVDTQSPPSVDSTDRTDRKEMLFSSHCRPNSFTFLMATLSQITSLSVAEAMLLSHAASCAPRCPGTRKVKVKAVGFVKQFCLQLALLSNHSDHVLPI